MSVAVRRASRSTLYFTWDVCLPGAAHLEKVPEDRPVVPCSMRPPAGSPTPSSFRIACAPRVVNRPSLHTALGTDRRCGADRRRAARGQRGPFVTGRGLHAGAASAAPVTIPGAGADPIAAPNTGREAGSERAGLHVDRVHNCSLLEQKKGGASRRRHHHGGVFLLRRISRRRVRRGMHRHSRRAPSVQVTTQETGRRADRKRHESELASGVNLCLEVVFTHFRQLIAGPPQCTRLDTVGHNHG